MFLKNWTKGVVNSINAMLTKKVKVSKFTFSPLILGASVLSLFLCVILGVKIYSVFADESVLFTDSNGVKYYATGTSDTNITLKNGSKANISVNGTDPLYAYIYSNGLMIYYGVGTLKDFGSTQSTGWYNTGNGGYNDFGQQVDKIAISNNGFKPTNDFSSITKLFELYQGTEIYQLDKLNTSEMVSMDGMFYKCTNITSLTLPAFDISKVQTMSNMFSGCTSLERLDLSNLTYSTNNLSRIISMFEGCSELTHLNLSGLNFSEISSNSLSISGLNKLQEIVLPKDISTSSSYQIALPSATGKVWMGYDSDENLFSGTTYTSLPKSSGSLYKIKFGEIPPLYTYTDSNGDIYRYYTDGHTKNSGTKVSTKYSDKPLSNTGSLVAYYYKDDTVVLDGNGTLISYGSNSMIDGYNSAKRIFVSNLGFIITDTFSADNMFKGLTDLVKLDIKGLDMSKATSANNMFNGCTNLEEIILPDYDVLDNIALPTKTGYIWVGYKADGTSLEGTYTNLTKATSDLYELKLEELPLYTYEDEDGNVTKYYPTGHKYNGSALVPTRQTFNIAKSSGTINAYLYTDGMLVLSGSGSCSSYSEKEHFRDDNYRNDIEKVASADNGVVFTGGVTDSLFNKLSNLTYADLRTMDIREVTSVKYMFNECTNLKTVLIGDNFRFDKCTNAYRMFRFCSSLEQLDLSKIVRPQSLGTLYMQAMFLNCTSLKELNIGNIYSNGDNDNYQEMFGQPGLQNFDKNLEKLNIKNLDLSNLTSNTYFAFVYNSSSTHEQMNLNEIVLPSAVSASCPLELPKKEGYQWVGYLDGTEVSSNTYTSLPARSESVDTIKLVKAPIYQYTENNHTYKYYVGGYTIDDGELNDTNYEVVDLSGNNSLCLYSYGDGMAVLLGEGNLKDNLNIKNEIKQKTTKAVCSTLGFKPNTLKKLFCSFTNLTSFDGTNMVCTNIQSYEQMFDSCGNLKSVAFPNSVSENTTSIYGMFRFCESLTDVNLANLNGAKITDAMEMFSGCTSLENITFPSVTFKDSSDRLSSAFLNCSSLETVSFANGINTSKVTSIGGMFNFNSNQTNLVKVDFSNCNFSNVTSSNNLWGNAKAVNEIILPSAVPSSTSNDIPLPTKDGYHWVGFLNGTMNSSLVYTSLPARSESVDTIKLVLALTLVYECTENGKTYKYYDRGYTIDDGDLIDTNCQQVDLSSLGDNSLCLYSYDDGMAVLRGTGNLSNNLNIPSAIKQKTTKAVCSTLGFKPNKTQNLFSGFTNLVSFDGTYINGTNITSLANMFSGCSSLKHVNLANLNGQNVTDAYEMFYGCTSLENITFPPVKFNGSPNRLACVFQNCSSLKTVSFANGIDTSNVTQLIAMFSFSPTQTELKTVDFSNCNFSSVTNSDNMWYDAKGVEKIILPIDVPVSHNIPLPTKTGYLWMGYLGDTEVSSKTYTSLPKASSGEVDNIRLVEPPLLYEYNDGTDNYKYYIGGYKKNNGSFNTNGYVKFDLSVSPSPDNSICAYLYDDGMLVLDGQGNVNTGYGELFRSDSYNTKIKKAATSINGFEPDSCENLFDGLSSLTKVDLSTIDTSSSTSMKRMFYGCYALSSLDLSMFDTANVISMSSMFQGCTLLTSLNLSNFNTLNVNDMSIMFNACVNLSSLDLSSFNTTNVINMSNMFSSCSKLTTLTLGSNFITNNVTSMYAMFSKCKMLSSINVSNFNTSKVEDMSYMFEECNALSELNDLNFNTSSVKNMKCMFKNCNTLSELNVSSFDTSEVETIESMFEGCSNLTTLTLQINDNNLTTAKDAIFGLTKLETLDLRGSVFNKNITNNYLYIAGLTNVSKIYIPKTVDGGAVNLMDLPSGKSWVLFNIDGSAASSSLQTYLTGYSSDGVDTSKEGMYLGLGIPIDLATASFPDVTYNGAIQTPSFTLTYNSTPLVLDTDYEIVEWGNNKDACLSTDTNAPYVKIKGKGTYAGETTINFTINKMPLTIDLVNNTDIANFINSKKTKSFNDSDDIKISENENNIFIPGASSTLGLMLNITGKFNDKYVNTANKVKYTFTLSDNTDKLSNYQVTFTPSLDADDSYEVDGSITKLVISFNELNNLMDDFNNATKEYDGDDKVRWSSNTRQGDNSILETNIGGYGLMQYYIITGKYTGNTDNTAVGTNKTYTLHLEFDTTKENYELVSSNLSIPSEYQDWTYNNGSITAQKFKDSNVTVTGTTYTGSVATPSVEVKIGDKTLVFGTDYTFTTTNIDATNNAEVVVTGIGNYAGSNVTKSYTISPYAIEVDVTTYALKDGKTTISKVYDGTKNVLEQINEQLDGVNNEKVCISCSGEYDTKDAGDNKDITYTCTFSGVTGGQANKNNYIVTFKDETSGVVTLDGIGTIIKKQIAMDWSTFNNLTKVYDGDNIVKFNNSGTLEITKTVMQNTGVGEAPNEEQIKVIVSGTYSSSSVNTHTYTLNASLDDSFDANKNYELTDNTNKEFTNGNITNFDMTDSSIVITANYTNTFEYDSTNKSSEISINDFAVTKDGDSVSLDEFTLVFDDPDSDYTNCGTHKFKLKAKDGGNYSGEKEFTFTITQRKIKANDITLDTYSNSNPLVKEYDKTLNLKDGVTPTLRYVKRINDNLSLDIILDYDLTNSKYDSISGRDKDNLDNKDPRDKRDLIFSNVKLKSSDTNYVLVDNDGTTVLDKFNSLSFDDCGQIIDTTKPVITSSAKSVTTVGKGGTLRITLTCSEDLVHDFSVTGFDASKLYIELFSKEANVSYGKAIINTDVSLTKDNVLVFDYSVPTDDQKFEDIRIAGFTIELQNQSGVSLTDDCGNELVTDSLSNDVINTFDDLVIDTRGIALNIKAYSDSTFTNEINRDSITNLFDIYYKFIFGDDVSGFDASDIDVTNGTLSEFIKVDDKTYTCKVSNIGKLSATDTDGIIQSVSVAKDKAQDNNGNFNVSDTLNLTIKRNLIIKDETLLLNIPGLDAATKVIIKTNDILNKVSYSLYEIFNNVTGTTNFASGDTLTITDITTNGLIDRYIIKVNGHKDDYISTEETFTYLIKNIDHIAKEIIDKVLPSLNQSDNDLRSIIKNNDNKEIYELPADVRDILTNDTTNKVTDLIIVGIKDLITDKHVDELDDSSVIKDDIKDLITEIARLGDKIDDIITDAMDYEQRMITYQSLTIVQKEYMYRHYHDEIENLHTKYYELIESCKSNTIESLDNDDSEVVEVYGVINKLKDGLTQDDTDDVRTLSVDKIKEEEKLNKINDTLENKGLLTDKKVIIPYDIKILLNGIPVEHVKTDEKLLIKLKLPREFYEAVFKIYHLNNDYTLNEEDGEIEIVKQLINGECLIYFFADSFSPYIPVSNLRTLRIETNNDTLGTVNPKGLQAVNVGENKTITVNPNNGYEASITVNGTKVKEKFSGSYTITNIQENLDVFVEFTMKEEPTKPDEPKPEKPSITNATVITIQTANHVPYINGYSDKTFRPNNNMTRAEFSKVIATISNNFSLSYDNDKYIDKYKDVKDTSWYSSYVGYVTKIGLMKGYSDGTFKPNEYITRAEASKVLSDMFNVPDKQIENIFFNELNGHWYFNSTNELIKGGVIKGYSDGTFKANKNITRAEVISLINRVKDRTIVKDIDKGYQNMMDNKFKDVSKSNWFYNDLLEAAIAHNSQDLHK